MTSLASKHINTLIDRAFRAGWRSASIYAQLVANGDSDISNDSALDAAAKNYLDKHGFDGSQIFDGFMLRLSSVAEVFRGRS